MWFANRQKKEVVQKGQPLHFKKLTLNFLFAEHLPKIAVHIIQISLFAYHLIHKESVLIGDHFCHYFTVDIFHRHSVYLITAPVAVLLCK